MRVEQFEAIKKLVEGCKTLPNSEEYAAAIKEAEDSLLCYDTVCIKCKNEMAEWGSKNEFNFCSSCWNE